MLLVGQFDESGSPTIRIRVSGPAGSQDYVATVDTGFTGFVALPMADMVPLGLATEPIVASVMLGNGAIVDNLVAQGRVALADQSREGAILLDPTTNDVLVGMALLRTFNLALILTDTAIVLHDSSETLEVIARFMQTAPQGLPDVAPAAEAPSGAQDE